jgi:TonB-linked SusC/RagA family outer membrane protein
MKNFLKLIIIPLVLVSLHVHAQKTTFEGIVLTKTDQAPLPGATVIIKGTTQGTQTDANGKFSIAASTGDILQISFIGFKAQQIQVTVSDNSPLQILLEEDDNRLQEVVVTALGISKEKKSLGYAVQELKSKDVTESRTPNLVNALTGKIAGVNITNSQGGMGSSRIVIRGETSIAGNNQPLFVVDGVPVDNSQLGASGASRDFANAISDINSEDIESISVLKGPNAAALYGSRAANGVILIKTKSGKGKKGIGISINSNTTFENLLVLPEYQNVYGQGSGGEFEYVDGKGGGINDGVDESWGPKMDGRLIKQFYSNGEAVPFEPHPNNVRDFFVTGHTLNNGIALAGSKEDFDYRFSYNNSHQKGVVPNTDLTKNSFAINSSYKLLPNLTIATSANFIRNSSDNLPGTFGRRATSTMLQYTWFGRQVDINRLKNYRDENGNTFNWNNSYYSNPYFIAYENTVSQRRDRIFGNVNLTYNITPNLTANLRTGNDYYNDRRKIKVAYGTNGTPFGSYQEIGYTVNENNTQFTLNYKKDVSDNFSLDILGGGNLQSRFLEENNQRAPRLAVKDVYTLNNSRDPLESTNFFSRQKIYSVFSSAQLGFKNYAFLNLTARNDWSSTLPAQNNSYFYPSANASIVLSEALGIASDALTFLKIRGGWSKVGKDSDPYQLINTYPFNTPFGSAPLITVSDKSLNPNLKPETTTSTEIGAEAGFLDDRIRLDVSYYNTNSFDQILNVDVSASTGYTSQLINAGRINNKGLEVQLNLAPIRIESGFSWEIGANFAANRSKVVELDKEGFLTSYRIGNDGVEVQAAIGQRYGTLFGTAFQRNENGQIIVNANGTPVVNPAKQVLGAYQPKWWGGINNTFSYKGLSLSFLIDTKVGGSIYSGTYSTGTYTGVLIETLQGRDEEHGGLPYYYAGNNNKTVPIPLESHEAATPAGETVYHDGMIFNGVNADGSQNTRTVSAQQYHKSFRNINEASVFDASFVKFRELKVGYTLPTNWTNKVGIGTASVALVGRNLWIIHKNVPHIDPETAFTTGNAQGTESLQLPTTRSLGFNVSLNF